MRHIKVARADDMSVPALQLLVRDAVELNKRFGDPTRGEATRAQLTRYRRKGGSHADVGAISAT